ncbi:MerC mercury resistance protein [Nitrosomonas aestuarii]|uniref:MerC mercury resistance protein n=1 Tax=Nitrosomonas aestuarii TaxID=52441 RepID=A0A1I3XS37_9PROT|nr:MerC domain-containing protein [Nitrosomonas aestuarii]SFK21861.1 MerC mercury resistance protein [Nitrosomonas aestuarii]
MLNFSKYTPILDKCAICASVVCAFHCLSLPFLLSLFPALAVSVLGQELFHEFLLGLVIPLSLISLSSSCRRHKNWSVALLGLTGLIVLIFTVIMGHEALGEDVERATTLIGASLIAAGHLRNYALCHPTCKH